MQVKWKFERLKNDIWFKPLRADLHQKATYKARQLFYIILQIKIKINPGNFKLKRSISMENVKVWQKKRGYQTNK